MKLSQNDANDTHISAHRCVPRIVIGFTGDRPLRIIQRIITLVANAFVEQSMCGRSNDFELLAGTRRDITIGKRESVVI